MLLTVVFVYLAVSPVWGGIYVPCSSNCTCWYDDNHFIAVNCSSRGFYSIPQDVPETAISLDLSYNLISTWRTGSIAQLVHLSFINLSNNVIKEIITVSKKDSFITDEKLRLVSDQNEDSHLSPSVSHSLRLKTLLLNDNQIVSLDNEAFAEFSSLEKLDLSRNRLNILPPGVFRGLYSLESLNLQQNNLDILPETYPTTVFADLKRLKRLNIQRNYRYSRLSSLTLKLTSFAHLNNTDVRAIVHRTYPDKALSSLVSLSVLQMDALHYDILPGPGFRNLTNLTVLDFSKSAALTGLPELFFSNFSFQKPLQLILSECGLTFIHPGSFAYLPTLHSLSLRDNAKLEFSGFEIASRGFLKTNIKRLDISLIHGESLLRLQEKSFRNLKDLSLEELIFDNNQILFINSSAIAYMPRTLRNISLGNNKLNNIDFLSGFLRMTQLEIFNISVQNSYNSAESNTFSGNFQDRPEPVNIMKHKRSPARILNKRHTRSVLSQRKNREQLREISEEFLRKLQGKFCSVDVASHTKISTLRTSTRMFNVSQAMVDAFYTGKHDMAAWDLKRFISHPGPIAVPMNLKEVYWSETKLGTEISEISFNSRNALKKFDLSRNNFWCFGGPVTGLRFLEYLDLSGNHAILLSPYFFTDMSSLKKLLLSSNVIGSSLEADIEGRTFSQLSGLEFLDLSECAIRTLHPHAFISNRNLRVLLIPRNALDSFQPDLSQLRNLSYLDLSHNDLRELSTSTRASLDLIASVNPAISIDLSENPLVCDCSAFPFLNWILSTKVHLKNLWVYRCKYVNGSILLVSDVVGKLMPSLYNRCHDQDMFTVVLMAFFVLTMVLTVAAIYSHFHSRLLFLIYISKKRYFKFFFETAQSGIRDVFLVFDDESRVWRSFVARVVKPALERRGVSCYISEIDSLAGRPTRLVVEESVLAGKKTLVLLTRDLLKCEEKVLEINMSLLAEEMRVTEVLVFLCLEEMTERDLPNHIYRILQRRQRPFTNDISTEVWRLYIASPQQRDLRLSGPLSGQGAGSGAQTCGRDVPADLRADRYRLCHRRPLSTGKGKNSGTLQISAFIDFFSESYITEDIKNTGEKASCMKAVDEEKEGIRSGIVSRIVEGDSGGKALRLEIMSMEIWI
ncbi:toll-like receptor g [Plakobranchus ocellatus]|uniref:Toll-like receptor g n=1 Tax=Plakobranchus ocellatus TaxID=259542 RepID=A0AAV3YKP0_9GAST|nr:toll-like receptor g [Plakobranchus ocellatus]